MALIFQYGSNTSIARLNSEVRLDGNARKIGIVYTKNKYSFDFTVWSKGNACAVADIIPNGDTHIWGVLYDIPDNRVFRKKRIDGTKCLDQIEGEGYNYERIKIEILDHNGDEVVEDVWTYVAKEEKRITDAKTSKEYINHIIKGLAEAEVPHEYVKYVKQCIRKNNPRIKIPTITTSPKIFQTFCENALQILNGQFRAAGVITHGGSIGQVREELIRDFLTAHLPELIHVVSGQIIDAHNNYSKQQDAILVLKRTPRLPFSSNNELVFIEGVIGSIEIKSKLDNSVIKKVGDNLQSVRQLIPSTGGTNWKMNTHKWTTNRPIVTVVTYRGSDLTKMIEVLTSLCDSAKPDLVLDLASGLLVRNHGLLLDEKKSNSAEYILFDNPAVGFKMFLTFLTEIASAHKSKGIYWRKYW